jgi:hypothetical protein
MRFTIIFLGLFIFALTGPLALAAQRKVYFSGVAQNYVKIGLPSAEQAKCLIAITNNSSISQNYSLYASSSNSALNGGGNQGLASDPSTGTLALAAGASVTYTVLYQPLSAANTTQVVTCSGYIIASDPGAPSGFVTANASLITFSESAVPVGGSQHAVFTPINIVINGGKPF